MGSNGMSLYPSGRILGARTEKSELDRRTQQARPNTGVLEILRRPGNVCMPGAAATERVDVSVSDRQRAMSWAQRLKRVFAIDIETCRQCGGKLRVIASIEEPAVIERILDHLGHTAEPVDPAHPSRAPPQGDRLV